MCGHVLNLDCFTRIPIKMHINVKRLVTIYTDENDWEENELDKICVDGRKVEYHHNMCGEVFSDEMSKRFIDRMRANYKFYAGLFRVHHRYLKHRVLSHSLLVVVSAREVKKVGAHYASCLGIY